jgi:hypothetical protein
LDKENGNRKRNRKKKREKSEKKNGRAPRGIITEVKLVTKEKRHEKGEEERCMERKVHIGNKCLKTMTIYN